MYESSCQYFRESNFFVAPQYKLHAFKHESCACYRKCCAATAWPCRSIPLPKHAQAPTRGCADLLDQVLRRQQAAMRAFNRGRSQLRSSHMLSCCDHTKHSSNVAILVSWPGQGKYCRLKVACNPGLYISNRTFPTIKAALKLVCFQTAQVAHEVGRFAGLEMSSRLCALHLRWNDTRHVLKYQALKTCRVVVVLLTSFAHGVACRFLNGLGPARNPASCTKIFVPHGNLVSEQVNGVNL